jgi:CHAT domain-containing protein
MCKINHLMTMRKRDRRLQLLLSAALLAIIIVVMPISTPATEVSLQVGIEQYQKGDYRSAIATWNRLLQNNPEPQQKLDLWKNLAQAYRQIGDHEAAIAQWQNFIELAQQQGKPSLQGLAMTEQAQAYSAIGRTRIALKLLCNADVQGKCQPESALGLAQASRDGRAEVAALGSLGEVHRLLGEYDRANELLKNTLNLAQKYQQSAYQLSALNSLGNNAQNLRQRYLRRSASLRRQGETNQADLQLKRAEEQRTIAQNYLQQSLALAQQLPMIPAQVQARLGLLNLAGMNLADNKAQVAEITQLIDRLPASRDRVYNLIDLARQANSPELLNQAIVTAQKIQDTRSESFALGALGQVYEQRQADRQALQLTEQAILAADRAQAKDSRYQWEWQMARILRSQGQREQAIAAYEQSITTMESIRNDLLIADRNLQFDFRDSVEPIYRELIDLRFQAIAPQSAYQPVSFSPDPATGRPSTNLDSALNVLDSLRLAELQNYFGSDCVIRAAEQAKSNVADEKSAVIRTVILADRLVTVLSLPNQPEQVHIVPIARQDLAAEVVALRQELETYYNPFRPQRAQKFYQWLIQPFTPQLEAAGIETLAFVNDGILRSLPMAVLHDGQQFLIEKYAIATTPSLSLTSNSASVATLPKALAAGVTQEAVIDDRRFAGLVNVSQELADIQTILPGSQILQDAEFTPVQLRQTLIKTKFPIIHLATHGQFGAEVEDTFLVMGNQQKLSLNQLDQLVRSVSNSNDLIDLLTLTACQTAVGDDRAALGLAGIAIQAGAKSAIASLWSINDAATSDFSRTFYRSLKTTTKAKALQAAQVAMIRSPGVKSRPAYWAPYVLVGAWQ